MSFDPKAKCDSAFKRTILMRCYDTLSRAGFRRIRKESVDWPLGGGLNAWVGLNTGLYIDRLDINPFVGVHVEPIEKMWHEIEAIPYPGRYGPSATYAVHIGEISEAADLPAFAFTPWQSEDFVSMEIERLANLFATVGIKYARSLADYEVLLPLLAKRAPMLGTYPQRVACCLYLMGRFGDANRFVMELPPSDHASLGSFIPRFVERLGIELSGS